MGGQQRQQTRDGQVALTRVQKKRTGVRASQPGRQEIHNAARLKGQGVCESLAEQVEEPDTPVGRRGARWGFSEIQRAWIC